MSNGDVHSGRRRLTEDDDWVAAAHHPQVLVEGRTESAYVDEELAALVSEIWGAGLRTISSCQDVGESLESLALRQPHMRSYVERSAGRALVDFIPPDAQWFLDFVANAGPRDELYDRMTDWASPDAWETRLVVLDRAALTTSAQGSGARQRSSFEVFAVQVRFPRLDIPLVTARLRRHNSANGR